LAALYKILLCQRLRFFYCNYILKNYHIFNQLFPLLYHELLYIEAMQAVFYEMAILFAMVAVTWRKWPGLLYYINVYRDSERLGQR